MIPTFIRSFVAAAAVTPNRIAAFAAPGTDNSVRDAVANTDPLLGVFDRLVEGAGTMVDVHMAGLAAVEYGAAVQAGDPLTADADGRAIPAVAVAATSVRIIGFADVPGVAGDIADVFLAPGIIHQA